MINPNEDGITHINIYSKGKTDLGKLLSNFAHTPVDLGGDGHFESLEGYWYWLLCQCSPKVPYHIEKLRNVHGWEAKQLGREINCMKDWPGPSLKEKKEFRNKFMSAMESKLYQHPNILNMLIESKLPFKHYYVYNDKVVNVKNVKWILDFWTDIRKFYQNE